MGSFVWLELTVASVEPSDNETTEEPSNSASEMGVSVAAAAEPMVSPLFKESSSSDVDSDSEGVGSGSGIGSLLWVGLDPGMLGGFQ